MENKFIGYHCARKNLDSKPKGNFLKYIEYYREIVRMLPQDIRRKIQRDIDEYNDKIAYTDLPPISMGRFPTKFSLDLEIDESMEAMADILSDNLDGFIFVDEIEPMTNYGGHCYKVFMSGDNYIVMPDKLQMYDGDSRAKVYVYFKGTKPLLQKVEVEQPVPSFFSEQYKILRQIIKEFVEKRFEGK